MTMERILDVNCSSPILNFLEAQHLVIQSAQLPEEEATAYPSFLCLTWSNETTRLPVLKLLDANSQKKLGVSLGCRGNAIPDPVSRRSSSIARGVLSTVVLS
jgi:hypothetical protein